MEEITVSQGAELSDEKLRGIAKRVANEMILSAEKAAAHDDDPNAYPLPDDPDCLERVFHERLKKLRPEQREIGKIKARASIKAGAKSRARRFKDLAKVDMRSKTPVEKQVKELPLPDKLKLKPNHLDKQSRLHGKIMHSPLLCHFDADGSDRKDDKSAKSDRQDKSKDKGKDKTKRLPAAKKLELRIHRVICDDQTDDAWIGKGSDEIELGGTVIDETGKITKIPKFKVSGGFDDGESQVYDPAMRFAVFDINKKTKFPMNCFATFAMAESDGFGDLAGLLDKIVGAAKPKLKKILAEAASLGIPLLDDAVEPLVNFVVDKVCGMMNFSSRLRFRSASASLSIAL